MSLAPPCAPLLCAIAAVRARQLQPAAPVRYAPCTRAAPWRIGAMSSGNDALLDDEDSLEDAIRKARKEFPRLCDSENEEGNFDISLHKSRVENFMERLAGECERRGFWLLRNDWLVLHSDLYQNPPAKTHEEDIRKSGGRLGGTFVKPGDWLKNRRNNVVEPAAAAPAPKAAKPPPAPAPARPPTPPAPDPAAEPAVGAKPKKPAKRKSPAREPVEESEFKKWVKTRPWYPLFCEVWPWYPDEPSPAKKAKSEK